MKNNRNFDTIWRKKFAPQPVYIPQELYREYLPLVDVIAYPVYDENVINIDLNFQETISNSYHRICQVATQIYPYGFVPTIKQLIDQLAPILSGKQHEIHVIRYHRLIKIIPIDDSLLQDCRNIQMVILERLLLFEDMKNIYQDKDTDSVIDKSYRSLGLQEHKFERGAKVDALIYLIEQAINESKRVVVFVRNIPVCEALFQNLAIEGFRVNIVHGEIDAKVRRLKIDEFKCGIVDILIVTRLLYGRGFDLPQADMAIFYSPKESETVMWQEMLRIRSTINSPKEVYLLFYAWSAEAKKLVRLLYGMIATNAIWLGDRFRWAYSETEIPPIGERKPISKSKQEEKQSATKEFMQSLKQELVILLKQPLLQVRKNLDDMADKTGMPKVWPSGIVRVLTSELSATISGLAFDKKIREKSILRKLAKAIHPDRHPNASGVEKEFWHELFVALDI